uniref:Uncharacterized protein n=1 Tax=Utricularia reniformis TaxID=192314 RepID=A0A1Y0B1U2_9LAMI|nr:hypothetical protein AEK19_MT1114 [Utricularia reniformis]ART31333.1 hypothetical protein AEK19_MT1114 [Utricularia reniformis]
MTSGNYSVFVPSSSTYFLPVKEDNSQQVALEAYPSQDH